MTAIGLSGPRVKIFLSRSLGSRARRSMNSPSMGRQVLSSVPALGVFSSMPRLAKAPNSSVMMPSKGGRAKPRSLSSSAADGPS